MARRKHLIIGSGPAALSAVETIRGISRDDEITVVSRENSPPYCPAILPYLLAGRTNEGNIWLRDADYFCSRDVTFAPGREVVKIRRDDNEVLYADGATDSYDSLLVAAGAEPMLPGGPAPKEVLRFHTLDDCRLLSGRLDGKRTVTVLGAGLVAVELAIALVERGIRVKLIGRGRPLRAYFDERAGAYIRAILAGRGVEITTGKNVCEIKQQGGQIEVCCTDGGVFETDVLVSCLGVKPRLSFLEGSGIRVNEGVVVDAGMRTNREGIYAAGDIAEALSALDNRPGTNAILPNAIAQGKVAGANMAGQDCRYDGWIAMNELKFFGHSAFSIGMAMPPDGGGEVQEERDDAGPCFKRLVTRDGRLIGAMFINVDLDPGVIRYLIEKRVEISGCKDALFEQPRQTGSWLMLQNERNVAD